MAQAVSVPVGLASTWDVRAGGSGSGASSGSSSSSSSPLLRPVGMQLMAAAGEEISALRCALALEERAGFDLETFQARLVIG